MISIPITEIEGISIGQTEDIVGGTGCTVFISRTGMAAGLDIRGGGPASRDTELLNPLTEARFIHAIVLGGGSAFGLGAANGVMKYLEENDIGYDVGVTKVPLTVQSDIFDLTVGDLNARPGADMGYKAAKLALESPNYRDGNFGAGCGATVGKLRGMDFCMKSGIGSHAVKVGGLIVGAVVVVNALGDIYDYRTAKKVAGLLNSEKNGFADVLDVMCENTDARDNKFTENTTLGVIITNAAFSKDQLCKIAGMAHNGYARSIKPVHTSADGDSIYAVSTGDIRADKDLVGTLAADVMSEAILSAVKNAESAYGYPAMRDIITPDY